MKCRPVLTSSAALAVLAARKPRFDDKDFDRVKRLHLDSIRRRDDQPTNVAANVARKMLYGEHSPFAWPGEGTTASVRAFTLDDVKGQYKDVYGDARLTVIVAGDVTLAEAKTIFEGSLGDWSTHEVTVAVPSAKSVDLNAPDKLRVAIVDRPDAVQTVIRFELPGYKYADENRVSLRMLNTVFGGGFSSRLNQNLREQHGYTYGAGSAFVYRRTQGYFLTGGGIRTDATAPAVTEAGMTLDDVQGIMIAVAPVVGAPRVMAAGGHILRGLGLAIAVSDIEELGEEDDDDL